MGKDLWSSLIENALRGVCKGLDEIVRSADALQKALEKPKQGRSAQGHSPADDSPCIKKENTTPVSSDEALAPSASAAPKAPETSNEPADEGALIIPFPVETPQPKPRSTISISFGFNSKEGLSLQTSIDDIEIQMGDCVRCVKYKGNRAVVRIPDIVECIGTAAFSHANVEEIYLPSSCKTIEPLAFNQCKKLRVVHVSNQLISIGKAAFRHCTALTKLQFPESLTQLDSAAFDHCVSLKTLALPGVTELPNLAFEGCFDLSEIYIPKLQKLGFYPFLGIGDEFSWEGFEFEAGYLRKKERVIDGEMLIFENEMVQSQVYGSLNILSSCYIGETLEKQYHALCMAMELARLLTDQNDYDILRGLTLMTQAMVFSKDSFDAPWKTKMIWKMLHCFGGNGTAYQKYDEHLKNILFKGWLSKEEASNDDIFYETLRSLGSPYSEDRYDENIYHHAYLAKESVSAPRMVDAIQSLARAYRLKLDLPALGEADDVRDTLKQCSVALASVDRLVIWFEYQQSTTLMIPTVSNGEPLFDKIYAQLDEDALLEGYYNGEPMRKLKFV